MAQDFEAVVHSLQDVMVVEEPRQQYRPFFRVHTVVDDIQEYVEVMNVESRDTFFVTVLIGRDWCSSIRANSTESWSGRYWHYI